MTNIAIAHDDGCSCYCSIITFAWSLRTCWQKISHFAAKSGSRTACPDICAPNPVPGWSVFALRHEIGQSREASMASLTQNAALVWSIPTCGPRKRENDKKEYAKTRCSRDPNLVPSTHVVPISGRGGFC